MRLATTMIFSTLVCAGCSIAGTTGSVAIVPEMEFSLRLGQFATTRDGKLRIGFEGVTEDSRCPKGEQCVRAGDAAVLLWLQQVDGQRTMHTLRLAPGSGQSVRALDQEVRLIRLEPYPVTGKAMAAKDYIAALMVGRVSGAAADR